VLLASWIPFWLSVRKHFPSLDWNISFSKYVTTLTPFFEANFDPEYGSLVNSMKEILQAENDLQEIVQLVGKDSLSEDQKCTLETAKIIREDYLQQNGFSNYDFMCPLGKTIGMMKVIVHFHDTCQRVMAESPADKKITFSVVMSTMKELVVKVTNMKFELPRQPDEHFKNVYGKLVAELDAGFRLLSEQAH